MHRHELPGAARLQRLAAQGPLDQLRSPDRGDELAAQVAVGGQRGIDAARRDRRAELCPSGAVAVGLVLVAGGLPAADSSCHRQKPNRMSFDPICEER